eukprot:924597_1
MMDETHSKSQHPFEELKLAAAVTSHATKNKNMWNLNAIQFFPSYYSLERHHAYISNISNIANNNDVNDDKDDDKDDKGDDKNTCGGLDLLTSIASNISDCLKAEHVEIRYDPDEVRVCVRERVRVDDGSAWRFISLFSRLMDSWIHSFDLLICFHGQSFFKKKK